MPGMTILGGKRQKITFKFLVASLSPSLLYEVPLPSDSEQEMLAWSKELRTCPQPTQNDNNGNKMIIWRNLIKY